MSVCIYIYIYIYISIHTHTHTYIYIYIYINVILKISGHFCFKEDDEKEMFPYIRLYILSPQANELRIYDIMLTSIAKSISLRWKLRFMMTPYKPWPLAKFWARLVSWEYKAELWFRNEFSKSHWMLGKTIIAMNAGKDDCREVTRIGTFRIFAKETCFTVTMAKMRKKILKHLPLGISHVLKLGFFVQWCVNLRRLFNAQAILEEEQQWCYLTHSWWVGEDKGGSNLSQAQVY